MIKQFLLPVLLLVTLLGLLTGCESPETKAAGRGKKIVLRPPQTGSYIGRPVTDAAGQGQEQRKATKKPGAGKPGEEELVVRGGFR